MYAKAKSKKIFSSGAKFFVDPTIKRHKSQESYTDAKTLLNEKNAKTNKIVRDKTETSRAKIKSTIKDLNQTYNSGNKQLISKKKIERSLTRPIFMTKDASEKQVKTEENVLYTNYFENTQFNINNFTSNNNTKNEDFTLDIEEEYEDCNLNEVGEIKSSMMLTDFYTNSIGEASGSFLEKGEGLINNLPKPFVKQAENNAKVVVRIKRESVRNSNDEEDKKIQKIEQYYRRILALAKKGDRDGFLGILSKIYKLQGSKTNINFKDETGWSSIHYATDEGNLKIVEILIKMNVDVNMKTQNKKTPLHLAADKGYFDISRILIENGATISTLDDEKNNPIHCCATNGHYELLKYLLERFPQADTKNIYGKTPYDLANSEKIKELLKDYLNKNTYQYHKILIHDITPSDKKKGLSKENKTNILKAAHNKFQSSDSNTNFNVKNNINITATLTTNLNKLKKISKVQVIKSGSGSNSNSSSAKSTTTIQSQPSVIKIESKQKQTNLNDSINEMEDIDDEDEDSVNPYSSIEEEKVGPSSFVVHALLGKGSFGEVYLVEKKNTRTFYAMKILCKDKIMAQNLVKYAMTERNVLSLVDHPFIVKLSYAFQSNDKLFLILDYCPGGDLAEHLTREKKFSEDRAKIYLCEIILALEDLHKRDIIFRDLKPDNVVLDKDGHALLTDFGLSKEGVLDNKGAKSFCGSIAYLAPEMLKRIGHGKSVDWYLLGVLFYEMLVGVPPYFTNNKDQLFKNIEYAELQYPKYLSDGAVSLLKGLLSKDPLNRLGAGLDDAKEIKDHPYFKNVNWADIFNRQLKPPIPVYKNKVYEYYQNPKVLGEFCCDDVDERLNYFNGWSFIKNPNFNK